MNKAQALSVDATSIMPKGQRIVASRSPKGVSSDAAKAGVPPGQFSTAASDPIATIRAHCRALVESGVAADKIEAEVVGEMDRLIAHYMRPENTEARMAVLRSIARSMAVGIKGQAICGDRRKNWTAPNYTKGGNGNRLVALADHMLINFRLPKSGVLLREATADQIREAAEFYAADAADAAHKSRWLTACADHIASGKKLTEKRARALQEQTK